MKRLRIWLFVLILLFVCLLIFLTPRSVKSVNVSPVITPVVYNVKFKVVIVGNVMEEDGVFYMDLKVIDDPRNYLLPGEVMSFDMPPKVHKKYKSLLGKTVYLPCKEFFYVDIICNIDDFTVEE